MPISEKDIIIAGLRPMRSPIGPMIIAPIGRVRNPAPKVASESSRLDDGLAPGKNVRPI